MYRTYEPCNRQIIVSALPLVDDDDIGINNTTDRRFFYFCSPFSFASSNALASLNWAHIKNIHLNFQMVFRSLFVTLNNGRNFPIEMNNIVNVSNILDWRLKGAQYGTEKKMIQKKKGERYIHVYSIRIQNVIRNKNK